MSQKSPTLKSINPATEELIQDYEQTGEAEIDNRLKQAGQAFRSWRNTSFPVRSQQVRKLAEVLKSQRDELARLMTDEMGKPIAQARSEVEKCALGCEFYADHAADYLAERRISTDASTSLVSYDPLGAILAIMPWNFPFWQVIRFAAPAVMAGNVAVLKHAENVSGVALAIEKLFLEAGFPVGIFTSLLIRSEQANKLIENPIIRAVTLTGSERAGQAVGKTAGSHLKKTVLELGGSDPFIVLADAEIASVAKQAAKARTQNSGQSCIAAKRFIVEQPIIGEFTEALRAEMEALRVDDPTQEDTAIGPLAREDLRDSLHEQVEKSLKAGAKLVTGGRIPDRKGFFYPPTVLGNVEPGMAAFDEETFGPVAAVITAQDRKQAIELANRSSYGLGASIWTSDPGNALEMTRDIEAGNVFVNEIVKSDPRVPFGGVKNSGYGRELSEEGIREFTNIKTVWVK